MNKVELLNYIHWFSLKTQFKNTSGSVQLRLHNLNMTSPCLAGVAGGYDRPIAQLFLTLVWSCSKRCSSFVGFFPSLISRSLKEMFVGHAGIIRSQNISLLQKLLCFHYNQQNWNIQINEVLAASVTFLVFDYRVWISALWLSVIVIISMWLSDYWAQGGAGRVIFCQHRNPSVSRENRHKFLSFCWG